VLEAVFVLLEPPSPSRRILSAPFHSPPPLWFAVSVLQIVADFIIQLRIDKQLDIDVGYVTFTPWKLHFDGSACRSGCGVGIIIISPSGAIFEALSRLDHKCTNNQIEYEALLLGLQILHHMGVKHVEAYGDSLLVV
jgi:hypothetical protein